MVKYFILFFIFVLNLVGCASGHCRREKVSEPTPAAPISSVKQVKVYKYDGSKQCGQGKVISLAEMEKQLIGITVISRTTENDGRIYTRVCGAATGSANVYEISETDLEKAQKLGFLIWPPKR